MKKSNLIIIGIVLVLAVLAVGVFWYVDNSQKLKTQTKVEKMVNNNQQQNQEKEEENKKELINKIESKKTIEEIINIFPETSLQELGFNKKDMSDWKVYHNKDLGVEIKYPQDWTCGEGHCNASVCNDPNKIQDINKVQYLTFSAPGDVHGGGTWRLYFLNNDVDNFKKFTKGLFQESDIIKKVKIDKESALYIRSKIGKAQVPGENGVIESFLIGTNNEVFLIVNEYFSKRDSVNIKFIK